MRIEVLYLPGCPNYLPALDRLRSILREQSLPDEIATVEVRDAPTAERLRFPGSPTIRINGSDIDPETPAVPDVAIACRRYVGGGPSEELIRAALRKAARHD